MKSYPAFFGLNKSPFKKADLIFKPTLLQIIEYEDKINNNDKKIKKNININKHISAYRNNNSLIIKEKVHKNNKFKFIKKILLNNKNRNRQKIKCSPFSVHYEREIDPNEGTSQYFEQKYEKYIQNKKKNLIQKIENQKYKKSKFEFLKNEHIQKMNADLEILRQTRPLLKKIKKNYIISNYLCCKPESIDIQANREVMNKIIKIL